MNTAIVTFLLEMRRYKYILYCQLFIHSYHYMHWLENLEFVSCTVVYFTTYTLITTGAGSEILELVNMYYRRL
jgi:hypothetical protein